MAPGPATVLLCGPRAGGNSDTAGLAFADGLARGGRDPLVIRLREHAVRPCRGCGACAAGPGHACPLADDAAETLFAAIRDASVLAFASPIYFYHLPALFKALIDRAQRHYELRLAREGAGVPAPPERTAQVLLVSGRPQGRQLFTGSLLTLKYFLWPFHARPTKTPSLLRGFDAPGDLAAAGAVMAGLRELGRLTAEGRGEDAAGDRAGREDAGGDRAGREDAGGDRAGREDAGGDRAGREDASGGRGE